ncbi:MAG TPA: dienelactone hydrolase family protein [Byssovorax sp.]|jgi:carboxymethylenebutenolidase
MKLQEEWVELPGKMRGHRARPADVEGPLPGVLVIQEIWGADEHMRDIAARVASAGYVALAPDLFSRGGGRPPALSEERVAEVKRFMETVAPASWPNLMDPEKRGGELARLPDAERARVDETVGALFSPHVFGMMATYATELVEVAAWLRASPSCAGRKIGAMGFCMGGGLAGALAALDPALGAAAIFYGTPPTDDAIAKIACPLLGLFGADDARLVGLLPAFEESMKRHEKSLELHVYPATPHAFFNDTRGSYRVESARDAWARTLSLFARALA